MALFPQEREAHINVLNEYFHKLVVATQSCVSQIADKCLSRHLITSSTQNEILITVGLSPETKARKLLVAVRESMEHQNECLKTFLEVLDELIIFDDLTKEIRSALVQEKSRQKCRGSTGSRTSEKQFIKGIIIVIRLYDSIILRSLYRIMHQSGQYMSLNYFCVNATVH